MVTDHALIERLAAPPLDEFVADFLDKRRCAILTDVVTKWPAVERWNIDYLVRRVGDHEVDVLYGEDFARAAHARQRRRPMTVAAYARMVRDGTSSLRGEYMADIPLGRLAPLLEDIGRPPYCENSAREQATDSRVLFFGRDTYTPPHHHATCITMVCQIYGQKRMRIFPPSESGKLYPPTLLDWARRGLNPLASQVDIDNPDLARFPKFRDARSFEVVLEPGEPLCMPVHFWHAVYSPGVSMAVTFNFEDLNLRRWSFPNPGLLTLLVRGYDLAHRLDARRRSRQSPSGVRPTSERARSFRPFGSRPR